MAKNEYKGKGTALSAMDKALARWGQLKTRKEPWNSHYQRLSETFLTRKSSFTSTISPGDFLYDNVFENTGEQAALQAASVFVSMLWPDSARSFRLRPVRELRGLPGVDEYFRFVNEQQQRYMDAPRAGFLLAFQEFEIDQQVFGTSGLGTFESEDESTPVVYEAWNVKGMCVSENAQGFVDTIYYSEPKTVRQVIEEYDEVHPKVMELYAAGKYEDKVEVLKVIEPRNVKERGEKGVLSMAIRTLHIDVTHKHLMREKGYASLPVAVGRMIKTIGEEYGRSPAMTALPDASSLNALNEAIIVATEKQLDPPLYLLDDGRLGGGTVDTSAGALNVFNSSGRMTGEKPVGTLFTVGELQSAEKLKEAFKESIAQAFALDRLLDLNNQTQMTAFETSIRNRMRGEALGSMFSRQIAEVLTPTIERTFDILYRKGLLGVRETGVVAMARRAWGAVLGKPIQIVPEVIQKAIDAELDVYEVEYISPAKRFMQSEKLQGIFTAAEFFQKMAVVPGAEEILDNVNFDEMARDVITYSGAPETMQRLTSEIKAIREGRAQAQEQQAQLAAAQQVATVARDAEQAVQAFGGGGGQMQ
ncbi:MAG: hypothetical protein E4G90_07035 [Gemmatimonadales bacterium]|nr:MAG: hypothetical protein E4G90_07035 [Gemmatimonadales bacterium]